MCEATELEARAEGFGARGHGLEVFVHGTAVVGGDDVAPRQADVGNVGGAVLLVGFGGEAERELQGVSAVPGNLGDVYLFDGVASEFDGGDADTPWYVGKRALKLETIVRKREVTLRSPLLFEHLKIS